MIVEYQEKVRLRTQGRLDFYLKGCRRTHDSIASVVAQDGIFKGQVSCCFQLGDVERRWRVRWSKTHVTAETEGDERQQILEFQRASAVLVRPSGRSCMPFKLIDRLAERCIWRVDLDESLTTMTTLQRSFACPLMMDYELNSRDVRLGDRRAARWSARHIISGKWSGFVCSDRLFLQNPLLVAISIGSVFLSKRMQALRDSAD
jgi:hypothetical protein